MCGTNVVAHAVPTENRYNKLYDSTVTPDGTMAKLWRTPARHTSSS